MSMQQMTEESTAAPLIALTGPTGSGKSALAIELAEALDGEIVSCDSVAVYREMEIGTAKPSAKQRLRVPHHCLDLYAPNEACTAGDYARHARAAIAKIRSRGKLPIVAGGTGLYLRALLEGLAPAPPRDEELRVRLRARAAGRGTAYLHRLLQRLDARASELIHPNDLPKLVRSIEVTLQAKQPQTEQWDAGRDALTGFRVLHLGLAPSRVALYARINDRAQQMFARGLVEETAALAAKFGRSCRPLLSLGYVQALGELEGSLSRAEAIAAAQQGHRNYAKRQMTWFRREPAVHWLEGFGDDADVLAAVLQLAQEHIAAQATS